MHLRRRYCFILIAFLLECDGKKNLDTVNGCGKFEDLRFPCGVGVDSSNTPYVVDCNRHCILKIDLKTRKSSPVAGNGTEGYNGDNIPAIGATLERPQAVAFDRKGNLYLSEIGQRIRQVDEKTGIIQTAVGTGINGYNGDNIPSIEAEINYPNSLTFDKEDNLYFCDQFNSRVRKVDGKTSIISTVAGSGTNGYNGDNIPATQASLSYISGIAVDSMGNLYISDTQNSRVRKVDAKTGIISTFAGNGGIGYNGDKLASESSLNFPHGLAIDSSDNLYITDTNNFRIRKVDSKTGRISTVAGNGSASYNGDNILATSASIFYPNQVAVDTLGNLYIADTHHSSIRRVDASTGIITTLTAT